MPGSYSGSERSGSGSDNDDPRHSDREGEIFSDEGPAQQQSGGESGKEDDKAKKAPKKKKIGPVKRMMLSEDELTGRNGLMKLEEIFKDFQFRGKGYEKQDLDKMLQKYEYWCHVMHPKYPFAQVLERIEFLGAKKARVKVHLKKIRMGMINNDNIEDGIVRDDGPDNSEDELQNAPNEFASSNREHNGHDNGEIDSDMENRARQRTEFDWSKHNQADDFPDDDDDDALFAAIDTGEGIALINGDAASKVAVSSTPATSKHDNSDSDNENVTHRSKNTSKKAVINSDDSDDDEDDLSLLSKAKPVPPSPVKSKSSGKPSRPDTSDGSSQSSVASSSNAESDEPSSTAKKVKNSQPKGTTSSSRSKASPKSSSHLDTLDDSSQSSSNSESLVSEAARNNKTKIQNHTENSSDESDDDNLLLSSSSIKLSNGIKSHPSKILENSNDSNLSDSNLKLKLNKNTKPNNGTQDKSMKQKPTKNPVPTSRINGGKRRRVTSFDDEDDDDGSKLAMEDSESEDKDQGNPGSGSDSQTKSKNNISQNKSKRLRLDSSDEDEDMNHSSVGAALNSSSKEKGSHRLRVISDDSDDD